MNDSSVSTTSASGDADAPASKKARIDQAENSQPSPSAGEAVGVTSFAQGGARKGTLTLSIDDWNTFKNSTEKVYSEPLVLAGIRFTVEAFVKVQKVAIWLRAAHPTGRPEWHRKAEFALRWPRCSRGDTKYCCATIVFSSRSPGCGWKEFDSVETISRYVRNNNLTLKMDVTTFNCQVTDGIFGHQSRCHDVAFLFGNQRIYASKALLAAHSEFFEGMFFGDFDDRNKDEVELPTVSANDFSLFLQGISPAPPPLKPINVLTILRMADRFQAPKLAESCVEFLLKDDDVPFVSQLEAADELSMTHFRDRLIETATDAELTEAVKPENKDRLSAEIWRELFLKYRELHPPA